jgi:hypothetical protein
MAGHAVEHSLADRAMGVAAHHQQINLQVGGDREQGGAGRVESTFDNTHFCHDIVAAQILDQHLIVRALIGTFPDPDDMNVIRLRQERQCDVRGC